MPLSNPTRKTVVFLLVVTALIGISAGFGRHFGSQFWGGWTPGAVQMKEVTGSLFFCSAVLAGLLLVPFSARLVLATTLVGGSLILWLLVGTSQELLRFEDLYAPAAASGFPSLATLLGFLGVQCATMILTLRGPGWVASALAGLVAALGGCVVLGYLLEVLGASWGHLLYFYWPGRVTAVALPTGTAFLALGVALVLLAGQLPIGRRRARAAVQEIKLEHLAIATSFVFATWIVAFNSFDYTPMMTLAVDLFRGSLLNAEWVFAAPLFASVILQVWGLRKGNFILRTAGAFLAASVYFGLLLCAARSAPAGPGVPLFLGFMGGHLLLAIQLAAYQPSELRDSE